MKEVVLGPRLGSGSGRAEVEKGHFRQGSWVGYAGLGRQRLWEAERGWGVGCERDQCAGILQHGFSKKQKKSGKDKANSKLGSCP